MPENNKESLQQLLEQHDQLTDLALAMEKRLFGLSEHEKHEVEALSQRAINPQCFFDRKYRKMIYTLALFPEQVGWYWKLRERLHRFIHHH